MYIPELNYLYPCTTIIENKIPLQKNDSSLNHETETEFKEDLML